MLCQVHSQKVPGLILLINKNLKKMIDKKSSYSLTRIEYTLRLKQKGLRKELIKCTDIYKKKIESHFKQGIMKELWRGIEKQGTFEAKFSSSVKLGFK